MADLLNNGHEGIGPGSDKIIKYDETLGNNQNSYENLKMYQDML